MADYAKLTVVKLREELKRRGLSHAGLKAALVARLDEDDAAQSTADAPEQAGDAQEVEESAQVAPKASAPAEPTQHLSQHAVEGPTAEASEPVAQATSIAAQGADNEEKVDIQMTDAADHLPSDDGEDKETTTKPADAAIASSLAPPSPPEKKEESHSEEVKEEPVAAAEATAAIQSVKEKQETTVMATVATQDAAHDSPALVESTESQQDLPSSIKPTELPQFSTQFSTQTSIPPEDILEDTRKRKRRSHSPAPQTQEVAMKRLRAEDGTPRSATPEGVMGVYPMQTDDEEQDQRAAPEPDSAQAKQAPADARFKGLFAAGANAASAETQPADAALDRDIAPSVHQASTALYIRNLMRPLQATALKEHLSALARADGDGTEEDPTVEFFLDGIKSHCIVQFQNVAMASRVRLALHDRVWPDEKSRKALWVDFVPEAKVKTWISVEQDAAGSRPPKRWEVMYEKEDGEMVAYLQEADPNARRTRTLDSRNGTAPTRPAPATAPAAAPAPAGDPGKGFQTLDQLFKSTTAKPKLYFQPVSDGLAQRRLKRMAEGRGDGRGGDEMRRYTFEQGAMLVDNGPEFRPGYRGRGGGYPPRGGGYRGGDSWRGGR